MKKYVNKGRSLGYVTFDSGVTQYLFFGQFVETTDKVVNTSNKIKVTDVTKRQTKSTKKDVDKEILNDQIGDKDD